MTMVETKLPMAAGKVQLSSRDLHEMLCSAIDKSDLNLFGNMPQLIAMAIERKIWRDFEHKDFASYVLDTTHRGLNICNNQRLFIIQQALDLKGGTHLKEWADIIERVERMVKAIPITERGSVTSLDGNSLERLAKNWVMSPSDKITYLPSRAGGHYDRSLIRLRKNNPDIFKKVVAGDLTMVEARKAVGIKTGNESNVSRAQSAFRKMTKKERQEFLAWLNDEGFL